MINPDRKYWNEQQQELRQTLIHPEEHSKAIELFLGQHARVHAAGMSGAGLWSFEDEVLERVSEKQMRLIPRNGEHSIAWVVWHMTRIEDVTMNLLVAASPQVLCAEDWPERMKVRVRDTGNCMPAAGVAELSACMDMEALRDYRLAVGRRTRTIVKQLSPQDLKRKVEAVRLQQISREGALVAAAQDILDYWGGLTLAGLLLMPPTRHNFIHWNEALKIKQKFGKEFNEIS